MELKINDLYQVSDIVPSDKAAYVEHFKEKQIHDQTLSIPYPYSEADADWWINHNLEASRSQGGRSVNWAIRRTSDGFLVGGVGFLGLKIGQTHKAEIGYFLAKPFWGSGLMTEVVRAVSNYGFQEFSLSRITAHVFDFNLASARVLEKAGYHYEGTLRQHYQKNGSIFDGRLYSLLASDQNVNQERPSFIKHYREIQEPDTATYPSSEELLSIGSPFAKNFGFKKIGIHHEYLPPGRRTSWPHAESSEEEFIYVIEGNPDVWVDGKIYRLRPGDAVGFVPGTGICHTFLNNTAAPVRLLVVGEASRKDNKAFYAFHVKRNEEARKLGWLWENPPRQSLGGHDGLPDLLRARGIKKDE